MNSFIDYTNREADKEEILEKGFASDPKLSTDEKETNIRFSNDVDYGSFYSDVPTTVKWFFTIEESVVEGVRENDEGEIVAVKGRIPKGIVKLKGQPRKSNSHSQMVAYGPNND